MAGRGRRGERGGHLGVGKASRKVATREVDASEEVGTESDDKGKGRAARRNAARRRRKGGTTKGSTKAGRTTEESDDESDDEDEDEDADAVGGTGAKGFAGAGSNPNARSQLWGALMVLWAGSLLLVAALLVRMLLRSKACGKKSEPGRLTHLVKARGV